MAVRGWAYHLSNSVRIRVACPESSLRIAILEDDPDQLALLKRWLSDAGHDVHAYTSGRDTMRLAGRESFDIYVLDWQVPDVSGADVLKWIRGNISKLVPVELKYHKR